MKKLKCVPLVNDESQIKIPKGLFKSDSDWWNNACLNYMGIDWNAYAIGYKLAADLLVDYVDSKKQNQDILVFPIVFLYRQYLELRLKELILSGSTLLDNNKTPKITFHNIESLWKSCRTILEKVFPEDPKEDFTEIERVIAEFSITDPRSTGFRYPTDKEGKISLPGLTHINLRNLSELINQATSILEGASTGISVYLDMKSDYER